MLLELDDIQAGVIQPRPSPYAAVYLVLKVETPAAGRELLRGLLPVVRPAGQAARDPETSVSGVLSYRGLQALGVPEGSLASFPPEFRAGMAARADYIGDVGDNSPEHWEAPFGGPDVHVGLSGIAPDRARLDAAVANAERQIAELDGITLLWRLDAHVLPDEREAFGFRDGISQPAIEGIDRPNTNPADPPLKAGEFFLGYEDETGSVVRVPQPEVLGHNGTYVVFRKLHQDVAAFRRFLKANSDGPQAEALLAAKMLGRWPSGAPLALTPYRDQPDLGGDPARSNDFMYAEDDPKGLKTPPGSHIRRMNPRDAPVLGDPRIHRILRRGTSYGPALADGVTVDDGQDRGLAFIFVGAHLDRQFEFVSSQWVKDGTFIGANDEMDPVVGPNDGTRRFTVPQRPVRRRVPGLPRFVTTRGGEYFFAPSLSALRWIADLDRQ
jgi:Dyp-type peroxidase family